MTQCLKCKSKNIEFYKFSGAKALKCNSCGYDEGAEFQQFPQEKTNQKAKGKYNIYQTGGSRRTVKK